MTDVDETRELLKEVGRIEGRGVEMGRSAEGATDWRARLYEAGERMDTCKRQIGPLSRQLGVVTGEDQAAVKTADSLEKLRLEKFRLEGDLSLATGKYDEKECVEAEKAKIEGSIDKYSKKNLFEGEYNKLKKECEEHNIWDKVKERVGDPLWFPADDENDSYVWPTDAEKIRHMERKQLMEQAIEKYVGERLTTSLTQLLAPLPDGFTNRVVWGEVKKKEVTPESLKRGVAVIVSTKKAIGELEGELAPYDSAVKKSDLKFESGQERIDAVRKLEGLKAGLDRGRTLQRELGKRHGTGLDRIAYGLYALDRWGKSSSTTPVSDFAAYVERAFLEWARDKGLSRQV